MIYFAYEEINNTDGKKEENKNHRVKAIYGNMNFLFLWQQMTVSSTILKYLIFLKVQFFCIRRDRFWNF